MTICRGSLHGVSGDLTIGSDWPGETTATAFKEARFQADEVVCCALCRWLDACLRKMGPWPCKLPDTCQGVVSSFASSEQSIGYWVEQCFKCVFCGDRGLGTRFQGKHARKHLYMPMSAFVPLPSTLYRFAPAIFGRYRLVALGSMLTVACRRCDES